MRRFDKTERRAKRWVIRELERMEQRRSGQTPLEISPASAAAARAESDARISGQGPEILA